MKERPWCAVCEESVGYGVDGCPVCDEANRQMIRNGKEPLYHPSAQEGGK